MAAEEFQHYIYKALNLPIKCCMLWEKCLKVLIAQLKEDEPIPGWTIYVSLAKKKKPKKKIRGTHQASHSAEATSSA